MFQFKNRLPYLKEAFHIESVSCLRLLSSPLTHERVTYKASPLLLCTSFILHELGLENSVKGRSAVENSEKGTVMRKSTAASCSSLDNFLPTKKKSCDHFTLSCFRARAYNSTCKSGSACMTPMHEATKRQHRI